MDMKKIAIVAVAMLAVLCVVPCADAAEISHPDGTLSFDNMKGGDISFTVKSESEFTMTITVTEGSITNVVATKEVEIAIGTNNVSVHINSPSPGTHQYRVTCTPSEQFPMGDGFNVTVDVSKNVLSNWVTYLVIAIVIIVVAVFAYMKIRDTPKNKPEMTFEELEAQRKAEMAEKGQKKQAKSSKTTERQRYLADKKKKD